MICAPRTGNEKVIFLEARIPHVCLRSDSTRAPSLGLKLKTFPRFCFREDKLAHRLWSRNTHRCNCWDDTVLRYSIMSHCASLVQVRAPLACKIYVYLLFICIAHALGRRTASRRGRHRRIQVTSAVAVNSIRVSCPGSFPRVLLAMAMRVRYAASREKTDTG